MFLIAIRNIGLLRLNNIWLLFFIIFDYYSCSIIQHHNLWIPEIIIDILSHCCYLLLLLIVVAFIDLLEGISPGWWDKPKAAPLQYLLIRSLFLDVLVLAFLKLWVVFGIV